MKKLFFLSCCLFFGRSSRDTAFAAGRDTLNLVYIENSKNGGGLQEHYITRLTKWVDKIEASTGTQPLLFISNGNLPVYTQNKNQIRNYINRIMDDFLAFPNTLEDKKRIRKMIYAMNLNKIGYFVLDMYVSDAFMKTEVMNERSTYLLQYFPKEMTQLLNCPDNNITVNIHYPGNDKAVNQETLNERFTFYNSNKTFASSIKYNLIPD